MAINRTIVLSLGGSLIMPSERVNVPFLKKFRQLILGYTVRGYRFIIVTGGGDTARRYQRAAHTVTRVSTDDLDWIGIAATKLNAELVRSVFGNHAYEQVLHTPTKRVTTRKKVLIGSGWKPGCSSDKDAVMLAHAYGAKRVINMSNIPYVYTADPRKSKSATPIKEMTWDELLQITGRTWKPGAHVPFDPEAAKIAQRQGISVIVCNGKNLANLSHIISQRPYRGTTIS